MLLPAAAGPWLSALTATALSLLSTLLPGNVTPVVLLRGPLAVAGGELDLELVQLVPFSVGTLPLRNGLKLLQAVAG
jgi:hypothetical protein